MIARLSLIALTLSLQTLPALAEHPEIEGATLRQNGSSWTVSVTLRHPDTGWDHYADGWEVLSADGTSLGLRVLAHPHVNEQPFTRSLSGVDIPAGTTSVFIRARCNTDGWGEELFELKLPSTN